MTVTRIRRSTGWGHPSGVGRGMSRGAASPPVVEFDLFSSTFCGACLHTRTVLERAVALVPGTALRVHDVAIEEDRARAEHITATPTVIVRDHEGREVLRAGGVPTLQQVLVAADRAAHPQTR
ncbi:hypothetical protein [Actinomyces polynesiensis]|uniref:hypothetical protein n=1 Tax=Actinomyces polynesiensis TaxID=1325934 RepID=UPI000A5CAE4B|nr:hypothetical protein [Actinomyces polynesiensis]